MSQETQAGSLYQPRGVGWGGRWEGGSKGGVYIYIYIYMCVCVCVCVCVCMSESS